MGRQILLWCWVFLLWLPFHCHAWTSLGPWGGRVSRVSVSAADAGFMAAQCGGTQVYLSSDGGDKWETCGTLPDLPEGVWLSQLTCSPWQAGELFAVADALMHSDDFGQTWERKPWPGDTDNGYWRFDLDGSRDGHILCYSGLTVHKGYMSKDRGETWAGFDLPDVYPVEIVPGVPGAFVAMSSHSIFRSLDSGATWQEILNSDYYVLGMQVTSDASIWVTTVRNIFKRDWTAAQWEEVDFTPGSALWFYVSDGADPVVFASSRYGGVYRMKYSQMTWTKVLAEKDSCENIMITGTGDCVMVARDDGLHKSMDAGDSFQEANFGIDYVTIYDAAFDPFVPGRLLAVDAWDVHESLDGGLSWTRLPGTPPVKNYRHIVPHPDQPNLWYLMARSDVFVSHDGGHSWHRYMENLAGDGARPLQFDASTGAIAAFTASRDYSGDYFTGKLFTRDPAGSTWELRYENNHHDINQAVIDSKDPAHWLCAVGPGPEDDRYAAVWTSPDSGSTWETLCEFEQDIGYGAMVISLVPGDPDTCLVTLGNGMTTYYTGEYMYYGRTALVNIRSGQTVMAERNGGSGVLFLDSSGEDYIIANNGVLRAGRDHLLGSPVGNGLDSVYWLCKDPGNSSRILTAQYHGGISEMIIEPGPPPEPPGNVGAAVSGETLTLTWTLPSGVAGVKFYMDPLDGEGDPLYLALPGDVTGFTHSQYSCDPDYRISVKLSCYDDQGRESVFAGERILKLNPTLPAIMLGGATPGDQNFNNIIVSAYAYDTAGIETLDCVEVILDGAVIATLHDTGQSPDFAAGDGFFIGEVPLSADQKSRLESLTLVAVDQDGNRSSGWPHLSVPFSWR